MNTVLHIVSGDLWGGAEAQVLLQLEALSDTAWKPHLLLFNSGQVQTRAVERGIPIDVVAENYGIRALAGGALESARRISPAIVISHGYKESIIGGLISWRLGIPLIVTYHGLTEGLSGFQGIKLFLYLQIQRMIARFAAARTVTVSKRLCHDLGLDGNSRVRIIRNVTAPSPDLNQPDLTQNRPATPAILALGRLVPVKRLDLAIEAIRLIRKDPNFKTGLKDIELIIAGEGPEYEQLRSLAEKGGIADSVKLLGFQNNPSELLRGSTALVIASDSEGIPTALLEALATLTPVVATDVGGIREVLELFPDYPFRLVPAGSAAELARAISGLLIEESSIKNPAAVRETLNKFFSPAAAAIQLDRLYAELMPPEK